MKHLFDGSIHEREDLAHLASPLSHVTADAPPFLLIHGLHDETVPFEHAKRIYEALKVAGVEVTLPSTQAGHDWGAEWYEIAQEYLAFFQRSLCP